MAIVNQPTPLSNELAWNGDKNPIPDTNDGSKGLFSVEYGFPYVTQQPLAQGGIPPQRNDFNGVLNLLSKFIRYFQNGGVFAYSSAMDYSVGMLVRNGDRLYVCKAENGANTSAGVQNISNSNYWNEITLEDTLGDTLTNQLKTVLVTEAEVANNTTDWNSLTESRTYKISGATFSATYHQPVGANGNGELVVLKNGTDTIVQVYYANSTQPDQAGAFHRIYFGGAWTNWVYDITNQGGTINGNLNVDGNLGVTGNSNINGKLTVQNIEVSEGLTIGGAPPLKQDAIDKLQDQIIAPRQDIYVNADYGNDYTGNGTVNYPFATLDKAISIIKPTIQNVYIWIINNKPDLEYTITPHDFGEIDYLYIGVTDGTKLMVNNYRAKIKVKYGKLTGNQHLSGNVLKQAYVYGTVMIKGVNTVRLVGLDITVETGYDDNTKFCPVLFFGVTNFSVGRTFITANRILMFNQKVGGSIMINDISSYNLGTRYIVTGNRPVESLEDPVINPDTTIFPADNRSEPVFVLEAIIVEGVTEKVSGGVDQKSAKALYTSI